MLDSLNPKVQPQEPSKTFGCEAIIAGSLGFVNLGVFCPRGLWVEAEDSHLPKPWGLSRDVHRYASPDFPRGNHPSLRVVPDLDALPDGGSEVSRSIFSHSPSSYPEKPNSLIQAVFKDEDEGLICDRQWDVPYPLTSSPKPCELQRPRHRPSIRVFC